ncbi:hypothetical protein GIB67_038845 [Kingdonia uniflora]|uniref:Uncharacterized protein n=1 Tax=Kingdonia uniflora TaxID=39325 RepID=A0A7J7M101_9MAGN|nr:hypothetical protein GIB67_038845 [Kingdonia uniflora]
MENDQKELQLLPTPSSAHVSTWIAGPSSTVVEPYDGPSSSLNLQLSISLQTSRPPCRPRYNTAKIDLHRVEALKWQAAEQIRLAAIEKAYAERIRELTRREMEIAQSEFARARQMWESARGEMEKAERLKLQVDTASMEITCHSYCFHVIAAKSDNFGIFFVPEDPGILSFFYTFSTEDYMSHGKCLVSSRAPKGYICILLWILSSLGYTKSLKDGMRS